MSHLIGYLTPVNFSTEELLHQVYDKLGALVAINALQKVIAPVPARDFAAFCISKFSSQSQNDSIIDDSAICELYIVINHFDAAFQRVLIVVLPRYMTDLVKLKVCRTLLECQFDNVHVRKLYAKTAAKYAQLPQPRKVDKLLHKLASYDTINVY